MQHLDFSLPNDSQSSSVAYQNRPSKLHVSDESESLILYNVTHNRFPPQSTETAIAVESSYRIYDNTDGIFRGINRQ